MRSQDQTHVWFNESLIAFKFANEFAKDMTDEAEVALAALESLQSQHELTILKLSEPAQRSSDASTNADADVPTPATLSADLAHYRDLFTKLRFSYTEQVTKEKFLRYLVSSPLPPPEHISPAANAALEAELADIKDTLKQQKAAVNEQLIELEAQARELSRRHQSVETQAQELREMPTELERLRTEIVRMRQEQGIGGEVGDGQAEMGMGLEATVNLVEEREEQLERVQKRLEQVVEQRARKEKELKKMKDEAAAAERERDKAMRSAEDAKKGQKEGKTSIGDEVEEKGRWLRGVETTMKGLLGVEG